MSCASQWELSKLGGSPIIGKPGEKEGIVQRNLEFGHSGVVRLSKLVAQDLQWGGSFRL